MTPEVVLDLFREALWLVIILVTIIVVPGLIVGLIVAVFQAATQINEQTLSFLPRLVVTIGAVMWFGPWMLTRLMDYFNFLFTNIPLMIG